MCPRAHRQSSDSDERSPPLFSRFSAYDRHSQRDLSFFGSVTELLVSIMTKNFLLYDALFFLSWWHLLICLCSPFSSTLQIKLTRTLVPTSPLLSSRGSLRSKGSGLLSLSYQPVQHSTLSHLHLQGHLQA